MGKVIFKQLERLVGFKINSVFFFFNNVNILTILTKEQGDNVLRAIAALKIVMLYFPGGKRSRL